MDSQEIWYIHGSVIMHLYDFGDPLTFHVGALMLTFSSGIAVLKFSLTQP